jgi:hypothetical protein
LNKEVRKFLEISGMKPVKCSGALPTMGSKITDIKAGESPKDSATCSMEPTRNSPKIETTTVTTAKSTIATGRVRFFSSSSPYEIECHFLKIGISWFSNLRFK